MLRPLSLVSVLAVAFSTHAQITLVVPDTMSPLYQGHTADRMLFGHGESGTGWELWGCDGTAAGTHLVKDINPQSTGDVFGGTTCGIDPYYTATYNGDLYFLANDGEHGYEVWKSDGTEAGTSLLKDISQPPVSGQSINDCVYPSFCESNGILYFAAAVNGGDDLKELWRSDGTAAGTSQVIDLYPGTYGSSPSFLTDFNNKLYFVAYDPVNGEEVHVSDGTAAGTQVLKDIVPGTAGGMVDNQGSMLNPHFIVTPTYLYFIATDGQTPWQAHLWRTDGTEAGTIQLESSFHPFNPFVQYDDYYAAVNGGLMCMATGGISPSNLIKSDGTPTGTQEVITTDIVAEGLLHAYNDQLYFAGSNGAQRGLFKSDGTTAGTSLVAPFTDANASCGSRYFINFEGSMFFEMFRHIPGTNTSDWSVVQSNGTANGTVVFPGVRAISPLIPVGNDLLFYGRDSTAAGLTAIYKVHPLLLSVEEPHIADVLNVYPNPASGTITFSIPAHCTDPVEARLIDALGKVVRSEIVTASGSVTGSLAIPPDLADGMYELSLQSGGERYGYSQVMVLHGR